MSSIFSNNIRNAVLQFRAGRMNRIGTTVTADPRKGVFALVQQPSGSIEIRWEPDGASHQAEVRTVVGQVTVNRVSKCKTGRVFVIDFGGDNQLFYWLQEKSEERDAEYLKTLKKHIEKPSQTAAAPTASSIQMTTLQNILSNLGGSAAAAPAAEPSSIDLQRLLLSPEVLEAIRKDPAFYMSRLHEHLPTGTDPSDDVVPHVRNPQVSGAAAMLQAALSEPEGFRELSTAFGVQGSASVGALSFVERINAEPRKD